MFVYVVVMMCCLCCFDVLRVDLFCGGVAVLMFVCLLDNLFVCRFVTSRVCLTSSVDGLLRCCFVVLCVCCFVGCCCVVVLCCCFVVLMCCCFVYVFVCVCVFGWSVCLL